MTLGSLALVFALAGFFPHAESGVLCLADAERLGELGCVHAGDDFADGFFAKRTVGERLAFDRMADFKAATTDFAVTLTQFIHIDRHGRRKAWARRGVMRGVWDYARGFQLR